MYNIKYQQRIVYRRIKLKHIITARIAQMPLTKRKQLQQEREIRQADSQPREKRNIQMNIKTL